MIRFDGSKVFILHMDSLVFKDRINNFNVEKVYLDFGVNVNIIFLELLEKTKIKKVLFIFHDRANLWSRKR